MRRNIEITDLTSYYNKTVSKAMRMEQHDYRPMNVEPYETDTHSKQTV